MRAWGVWLPDLEWSAPRLRDAADALETILRANPDTSIEMAGEMGKTARELRALVQLINEASRRHAGSFIGKAAAASK